VVLPLSPGEVWALEGGCDGREKQAVGNGEDSLELLHHPARGSCLGAADWRRGPTFPAVQVLPGGQKVSLA